MPHEKRAQYSPGKPDRALYVIVIIYINICNIYNTHNILQAGGNKTDYTQGKIQKVYSNEKCCY